MKGILAAAGAVGLLAAALLLRPSLVPLGPGWARGIAAGALLGTAGSLAGFVLLLRNLRGSHASFLGAFFGGMLARWVLFGAALVAVVLSGALPLEAFLVGLIPSYLGFQGTEMWTLHRMQATATPESGGSENP